MALYVAVSTDCGCFVYANTTARTHRNRRRADGAGHRRGAGEQGTVPHEAPVRLAMEARMVADMELYDNGRVVVMSIPLALCRELGAAESDVEELSSLAALVQGTDCGITLRELKPGRVKLSLRTGPRVDASAVCRVLGGGGHKGRRRGHGGRHPGRGEGGHSGGLYGGHGITWPTGSSLSTSPRDGPAWTCAASCGAY